MNDNVVVPLARKPPAATPEGIEAAEVLRAEMAVLSSYAERAITQAALDIGRQDQNPAVPWRIIARLALGRLADVDGPEAASRYATAVGDALTKSPRPAA